METSPSMGFGQRSEIGQAKQQRSRVRISKWRSPTLSRRKPSGPIAEGGRWKNVGSLCRLGQPTVAQQLRPFDERVPAA